MGDLTDEQLERFLGSGTERPVILVLRAHRIASVLALIAFLGWAVIAFGGILETHKRTAFVIWASLLTASLALKFAARILDRRAMRKDLEILENR